MSGPTPRPKRLSVNLSDVLPEGLRSIAKLLDSEAASCKLNADIAFSPEAKKAMTEARARLIESRRRIERFLDHTSKP